MKLQIAQLVAEALVNHLRPACMRIEIKGSLARLKPEVKDIEILAVPDLTPVKREPVEFGKPIPRVFPTLLDKMLDEMVKDEAIYLDKDGPRYKQLRLRYAAQIHVDLFLNLAPSQWGVQSVIRTGPADFSHWCVCERPRGPMPDGHFVKHQVVWVAREIKKHEVNENPDKALAQLTETNHLSMPEEADYFRFLGLGWIEPRDRVAKWSTR